MIDARTPLLFFPMCALQIGVQEVSQQLQQTRQLAQSGGNQQQEQLMLEARDVDNSNLNVDDSRFDVPTERSTVRKMGDVLYQDGQQQQQQVVVAAGGIVPVSVGGGATGALNGTDIFSTTASMDADAKLR